MATEKQIQANRANALKSTGPSPESFRVTSRNATKHGLFSKHLPLREEDRSLFQHFSERVRADLQPQDPTESLYVDHLVDQCWRLRSCLNIEKDLFEFYRTYQNVKGDISVAFAHDASQKDSLCRLSRYASVFERGIHKDLAELRKLQARTSRPSVRPPDPVASAPDASRTASPSQDSGIPRAAAPTTGAVPPPAVNRKIAYPVPSSVLSEHVVLSDEDPTEFKAHLNALSDEWKAYTPVKAFLIELFAATYWRLDRISSIEAGLFEQYGPAQKTEGRLLTAFVRDATEYDCFSKLRAYETSLRNNLSRILKELLA